MRSVIILLLTCAVTLPYNGCIQEKEKNLIVNVNDTTSTAYTPPTSAFVNGPTKDIVLTAATVSVTWTVSKDVVGVRFKLDDEAWTPVIRRNDTTVTDLDEGRHTVAIRAVHQNGNEEEEYPSVAFTVDAVAGQSLIVEKRRRNVLRGAAFTAYLRGEDLSGIMGISTRIRYDRTRLRVNTVRAGSVAARAGLQVKTYAEVDHDNGIVRCDMAVLGGVPVKGLSASDTLFILDCSALNTVGETTLSILRDSTSLRNTANDTVSVNTYVDGKVIVR